MASSFPLIFIAKYFRNQSICANSVFHGKNVWELYNNLTTSCHLDKYILKNLLLARHWIRKHEFQSSNVFCMYQMFYMQMGWGVYRALNWVTLWLILPVKKCSLKYLLIDWVAVKHVIIIAHAFYMTRAAQMHRLLNNLNKRGWLFEKWFQAGIF